MSEGDGLVRVEAHGGWGELILDRPQRRNALAGSMVTALHAGLKELLAGGARAVLLRGEGGAFCSGLDLDAFAVSPPPSWRAGWAGAWTAFHRELYNCPAVIVGALERFAINAGASLALACDLLVVGEGAYLLVGEAAMGMHAPMNLAWLRIRTSEAVAAQLALGAQRVRAAELSRLGLAYTLAPDPNVVAEASALTARLAAYPGNGLASIKAALRRPSAAPGADIFETVQAL